MQEARRYGLLQIPYSHQLIEDISKAFEETAVIDSRSIDIRTAFIVKAEVLREASFSYQTNDFEPGWAYQGETGEFVVLKPQDILYEIRRLSENRRLRTVQIRRRERTADLMISAEHFYQINTQRPLGFHQTLILRQQYRNFQ